MDEWITQEQMKEICPSCAVKMAAKGITRIRASAVEEARRQATKEREAKEVEGTEVGLASELIRIAKDVVIGVDESDYESILKQMGFRQEGGNWVLKLGDGYEADDMTVRMEPDMIYLEIEGLADDVTEAVESKRLKMQGMYPMKLRREINEMLDMIKARSIAARVARSSI